MPNNNDCSHLPAIPSIQLTVNSERLLLLLQALQKAQGITSKQITQITGASNPYAETARLRALGWKILKTQHKAQNRYGKLCRYVRFHLSLFHKPYAEEALRQADKTNQIKGEAVNLSISEIN